MGIPKKQDEKMSNNIYSNNNNNNKVYGSGQDLQNDLNSNSGEISSSSEESSIRDIKK